MTEIYLDNIKLHNTTMVALFGLPLLYLPGHSTATTYARLSILVLIAIVAVSTFILNITKVSKIIDKNLQIIHISLAAIILGIYFSIIFNLNDAFGTLFGINSEGMGLLAWLSALITGITFIGRNNIEVSKTTLWYIVFIANIVVAISLILNIPHYGNLRMFGLLLQPTAMGMYTLTTLLLTTYNAFLYKSKINTLLLYISVRLSVLTILLTESRISLLLLFIFAFLVIAKFANRLIYKFVIASFLSLLLFTSLFIINSRFQFLELLNGIQYRLHLFIAYIDNISINKFITGHGANSFNNSLNSSANLPDDLLLTLDQGYIFTSAHNIFIDTLFYFGILFMVGFIILTIYAIVKSLNIYLKKNHKYYFYPLIFVVLCINGLLNTPSIELTPLFIISLFALQDFK